MSQYFQPTDATFKTALGDYFANTDETTIEPKFLLRNIIHPWTTEKKAQFFSGTQNQMGFAVTDSAILSRLVNTSKFRRGATTMFANQQLNAFGRWHGAPGGSGANIKNTFG